MAAVNLNSLGVAVETSYGSVDSTTGVPSNSGLSPVQLDYDRAVAAGFYGDLDEPAIPGIEARTSFGEAVLEPVTFWQSGTPVQRLMGSVNVSGHVIGVGDGSVIADHTGHPLSRIVNSMLGMQMPSSATDDITGVDESTFTPTDATRYFEGMLVRVVINGRVEAARVVDVDTGTPLITVAPEFSANPGSQTARLCTTFFPDEELPRRITGARGSEATSTATSLFLRGDIGLGSDARRLEMFGCRASRLVFRASEETLGIEWEATIGVPYATDDGLTASLQSPAWGANARPKKAVYHGARPTISADISGGSVGGTLAHSQLAARGGWELVLEATQSDRDYSPDSILQHGEREVVGISARLTMMAEASTTLEDMRRLGERRMVTMPCGPALAGAGLVVQIPAAHLVEYARPVEVDSRFALQCVFGADQFSLDDRSTEYADNRILAIGLPR